MKRYRVYGYAGQIQRLLARSARAAVRAVDFAVYRVTNGYGQDISPEFWA